MTTGARAGVDAGTVKRVRKALTELRGGRWTVNRREVAQSDLARELGRSRTWVVRRERYGGDQLLRLALVGILVLEGADLDQLVELVPELVQPEAV